MGTITAAPTHKKKSRGKWSVHEILLCIDIMPCTNNYTYYAGAD